MDNPGYNDPNCRGVSSINIDKVHPEFRLQDSSNMMLEDSDLCRCEGATPILGLPEVHRRPRKGRGRSYAISSASFRREDIPLSRPHHSDTSTDYGRLESDGSSPGNTLRIYNKKGLISNHGNTHISRYREADSAYNTLSSCSTGTHSRTSSGIMETESRELSPVSQKSLESYSSDNTTGELNGSEADQDPLNSKHLRRPRLKGTSESPPLEEVVPESLRVLGQEQSDNVRISGSGATGGGRIVGIVGVSLSSCSSTSSSRHKDTSWTAQNSPVYDLSNDFNITNGDLSSIHVISGKGLKRKDPLPVIREPAVLSPNLLQLKENRKYAHGLINSPHSGTFAETSLTTPGWIPPTEKPIIPGQIDIFHSYRENPGHKPLSKQVSTISTRSDIIANVGELTIKRLVRQMSRNRGEYIVEQPEVDERSRGKRTYFDLALFTCCCCVSPLGFIAVILAAMSDLGYKSGNYQRAKRLSRGALTLSILGIFLTLGLAVTILLLKMKSFKEANVYHRT